MFLDNPEPCRSLTAARRVSSTLTLLLCFASTAIAEEAADLVLKGGKIVTVDPRFPVVQAVSVRGDRIVAVGTTAELAKQIGPQTRVIDLHGKLAIPGFIEGHGHFLSLGKSKLILDLTAAQTWDEIVEQVAQAAEQTPPGTWILGRGWHQSKWTTPPNPAVDGTPTHDAMSAVTPKHPVLLTHASGHMAFANACAMELADVTRETPDPKGGQILRDGDGNPTGVLRERAASLVSRVHARQQQQLSAEQRRGNLLAAIQLAGQECLSHGVTSFHDAGSSMHLVDTYKALAERGKLPVRLWVMLNSGNDELEKRMDQYRMIGIGDHHLTVRAIKRLVDGALGSHGAWLIDPYDDLPSSRGLNTLSLDDLRRTAELAIEHQYQLCVHAIGDRANREVLKLYESAFEGHSDCRDLRWRIEHAQHLHPDDIGRFSQLGVVAAMQAVHATSDGPFVISRLGERRARSGAYVWQSLLKSGALVTNGTDVPVERIDPIAGFYSSVTRKMSNGVAFFPEQCMTREQALRSYTLSAAFSAFEDHIKGSLTPGKLADIVVLTHDIMTIADERIPEARVQLTIVGGQVLYERDE
jgi:predicted amidohydrolase YtcJ